MSAAFEAFVAYLRWLERRTWFRQLVARTEKLDARGRASGWW